MCAKVALFLLLFVISAMALDSHIDGAWRLVSATKTTLKNAQINYPYGIYPDGYLIYLPNSYMPVFIINKDFANSIDTSMLSYAGTYTVTKNQVTHHIQTLWKPSWIGTDQVRDYYFQGNKLILSFDGHDAKIDYKATLVWQKI